MREWRCAYSSSPALRERPIDRRCVSCRYTNCYHAADSLDGSAPGGRRLSVREGSSSTIRRPSHRAAGSRPSAWHDARIGPATECKIIGAINRCARCAESTGSSAAQPRNTTFDNNSKFQRRKYFRFLPLHLAKLKPCIPCPRHMWDTQIWCL